MHALGRLSLSLFRLEPQADVNSSDDQDIVFQLYLAHRFRNETFVRSIDFTRLQRAAKGSRKSTGRGRYHVIQSSGMWFQYAWRDFVMICNRPVNSEDHRLGLGRQVSSADRVDDFAKWPPAVVAHRC